MARPVSPLHHAPLHIRREVGHFKVKQRAALVAANYCRNCTAAPGQECYPEYGCIDADRESVSALPDWLASWLKTG